MCFRNIDTRREDHDIPSFELLIFSLVKRAANTIVETTKIPRKIPSIIFDFFEFDPDDDLSL